MQDKLANSTCVSDPSPSRSAAGSSVRIGPRRPTSSETDIQVNKRDGQVESIVINCRCGEQITIVCDYAEQSQ
jgi:hypothetical protein